MAPIRTSLEGVAIVIARVVAIVALPLVAMTLFALPAHAARVLVLGDSLSDAYGMPREAGWVHLLDQRLGDAHEVIDGAISGDTTAGAASRFEALLETRQPQLMVLILGGNDGLRGLDPGAMEGNLARIIEHAQARGIAVAIMQIRIPPNLGPIYIERFEAVYPRLAERYGIPLIDFFLDDLYDRPGMLMDDGIHPSIEAQPLLADIMEPVVREMMGVK